MGSITITLEGDASGLLREIAKATAAEAKLGRAAKTAGDASAAGAAKAARAHKRLGGAIEGAGKKGKKSFGTESLGDLAKYAAGAFGIAKAFQSVLDIMEGVNREAEQLARKQLESEGGLRRLAQLGGGEDRRVRELSQQARALQAAGGAANLSQAADVIFQLESAGINTAANRDVFARLGGVIADPVTFARSARTLQAAFGEEETGGIRGILSKAFAASGKSPAQAPAILEAAATAASIAEGLGISDEELLAATALLATTTGSASVAGTQLSGFLRAIGRDPVSAAAAREGGIGAAVASIEERGLGGQVAFERQFGKRFGAGAAFRALRRGAGEVEETRAEVTAAAEGDLVSAIAESADADAAARVSRQLRIANAKVEQAGEAIALRRNILDIAVLNQKADLLSQGKVREAAAVDAAIRFRRGGVGQLLQSFGLAKTEAQLIGEAQGEGQLSREQATTAGVFAQGLGPGGLGPGVGLGAIGIAPSGIFTGRLAGSRLSAREIARQRSGIADPRIEIERFLAEGGAEEVSSDASFQSGKNFAGVSATELLRLERGGAPKQTTADILLEAGGFLDPGPDTKALLSGLRELKPPALPDADEG